MAIPTRDAGDFIINTLTQEDTFESLSVVVVAANAEQVGKCVLPDIIHLLCGWHIVPHLYIH